MAQRSPLRQTPKLTMSIQRPLSQATKPALRCGLVWHSQHSKGKGIRAPSRVTFLICTGMNCTKFLQAFQEKISPVTNISVASFSVVDGTLN